MRVYSCPQCRQTFSPRPALGKNTMLAEMVEKLKKTKLSDDCDAGAGDVQCDVCTGRKIQSRQVLSGVSEIILSESPRQHESLFKGKRHSLTDATGRLQEMICQKHDKILEVFCRTDQKCICCCVRWMNIKTTTLYQLQSRGKRNRYLKLNTD